MSITAQRPIKGRIRKRVNNANLDRHEWDFRGADPDHFDAILFYEQERGNPDLSLVKHLLTQKNRRKIFDLAANAFAKSKLAAACLGTNPEDEYKFIGFVAVCWLCKEFPKPWMALNEKNRDEAAKRYKANKYLSDNGVFQVLSREELAKKEDREKTSRILFPQLYENPLPSPTLHIIQIDWARADDRTLRPLLFGLLKLRPNGVHPRKISTGKKAAVPIHKLKQLAAWRLKEAGFDYKRALVKVKQHQKYFPATGYSDLLPNYSSAGAWSDAVQAGRKIARGF